jgi:hypothetical protein
VPNDEELEGTTLKVYLYVVKHGKPVGPRDVMRGVNLSSPSVALRHLQKLETLELLQKNIHGEYTIKEKVNIKGHFWIGRNLVPRLIFYSFFFMGILTAEITILTIRFFINEPIQADFLFLTSITAIATILFLIEGIMLHLKTKKD